MFAERTNWNLAGNRLSEALARHRAGGKRLLDLTASNPNEGGFWYDSAVSLAALRNPLVYDHGWQIDFHSLQNAITPRTRGFIVVNPNNPTGHFVKANELQALNDLCAKRSLAIIADEVFLDFGFSGVSPLTLANNNQALTFTMSGLSKIAGLPQMKMAWLVANGPAALKRQAIQKLEIIADTYLSPNAPVQLAAPSFLEQRGGFQKQVMARVRQNLDELDRQLAAQRHCSRLQVEGGWYAVLRVPVTRRDEELALTLLESRDVYVHPGHFFDFPTDGYLVLSLIGPEDQFAEGMRRILELASTG